MFGLDGLFWVVLFCCMKFRCFLIAFSVPLERSCVVVDSPFFPFFPISSTRRTSRYAIKRTTLD